MSKTFLLLLVVIALFAGCAATPTIPQNASGQSATVSCSRLTSVYGVGTLIVVDLAAPRANNTGTITTDGNDCKTTITLTGPPAKAASAP